MDKSTPAATALQWNGENIAYATPALSPLATAIELDTDGLDDARPPSDGVFAFKLVDYRERGEFVDFRLRITSTGIFRDEIVILPVRKQQIEELGPEYTDLTDAMGEPDGWRPDQLTRCEFEAELYVTSAGVQRIHKRRRGNVIDFPNQATAGTPAARDYYLPPGIAAKVDAAHAAVVFDALLPRAASAVGDTRLRTVDLRDLSAAAVTPPDFVIGTLVPAGHTTLLGGHGGIGKSTLALSAAAHVACGVDWLGFPVRHGRALFVSLEDPGELVRFRLRGIMEQHVLDPAAIFERLTILDGTACDAALVVEEHAGKASGIVPTPALIELAAAARGADLIVIDNASDAYEADENNRRMVRKFVRQMLGRIARANGAGLLLLAHIDKQAAKMGSAGNSYSGSTAWHNSARSRLALLENDGEIELRHEKSNLGPKADPMRLRFTDQGVLVPAFGGDVFNGDDDVLLSCMGSAISRGDTISTARTGPAATHSHVRALPGFPAAFAQSRAFWQAIGRLEEAGRLLRELHTTPNRKQAERWSIPAAAPVAPIAPIP